MPWIPWALLKPSCDATHGPMAKRESRSNRLRPVAGICRFRNGALSASGESAWPNGSSSIRRRRPAALRRVGSGRLSAKDPSAPPLAKPDCCLRGEVTEWRYQAPRIAQNLLMNTAGEHDQVGHGGFVLPGRFRTRFHACRPANQRSGGRCADVRCPGYLSNRTVFAVAQMSAVPDT